MTKYIAGFFLGFLLLLFGTGSILFVRPIPLGLTAEFMIRQFVDFEPDTRVSVDGAKLAWSSRRDVPYIAADSISYTGTTGDKLLAENVALFPSSKALWIDGVLALSDLDVNRLELQAGNSHVQTSTLNDLFAAVSRLSSTDARFTRYIEDVSVQDIFIGDTDGLRPPEGSKFLLTRQDGGLSGVLQLSYFRGEKLTQISGRGYTRPGKKGRVDVQLERVNPADLAGFSSLFSPLSALSLPVDAELAFELAADGTPARGEVNIRLEDGVVTLSERRFRVSRFELNLETDLAAQSITLKKGRFNVDGVGARFAGTADFSLTPEGDIDAVTSRINCQKIDINVPSILPAPIHNARADLNLIFLGATNRLVIDTGRLVVQGEKAALSGDIDFSDGLPKIGLALNFNTLARETAYNLWPVKIGQLTRKWVTENISDGRIEGASIALNAGLGELVSRKKGDPMREDALTLKMQFSDLSIRPLRHLPPITSARANFIMRGTSFSASLSDGQMMLSDPRNAEKDRTVEVTGGKLEVANYRAQGAPSVISFNVSGDFGIILHHLNHPPLALLRNVDFDLTRLAGQVTGTTVLNMPLIRPKPSDIVFKVTGIGSGVTIDSRLGAYQIDNINGFADLDARGFNITGRGTVNDVPLNFNWEQSLTNTFSEPPRLSRLAISETLSGEDLFALGFEWAGNRLQGRVPMNIKFDGPIVKPRAYHFNADLTPGAVSFVPLSHTKEIGVRAHLSGRLDNAFGAGTRSLAFSYEEEGQTPIVGRADFTGAGLSRITMPSFDLGDMKNVTFGLTEMGGYRQVSLRATNFLVNDPIASAFGNSGLSDQLFSESINAILGDNFSIETQIDTLEGSHDERLDGFRLIINATDGRYERMQLEGTFADGSELIGDLARTSPKLRSYSLQAENGSNLIRFLGFLPDLEGGALLLQGSFFDDGASASGDPRDISGWFEMQSFRAREVPVLARLLSLGSLTGIADTLSGDGIAFDMAQFKFTVHDGKLRVKSGRFNGPALGLTTQGAFNARSREVDFGGTVVPAYGINSVLENIPLIGRVLTGRRGEGVFGFSYRVGGSTDDLTLLVNPLSVLTPGILRRVFEIGIGDLPEVTVTDDDQDEDEFED